MVCCCEIKACPTHFGCSYKHREIWGILEFELHFCALIVAHLRNHVEYIPIVRKKLSEPPFQMTNLAWQRTKSHRHLRRWCTRQGPFKTFRFIQQLLICSLFSIRLGILCRFVDKHWQKCVSQPLENRRIHPSIEWPFIVRLS
jgi:hypothetical protein